VERSPAVNVSTTMNEQVSQMTKAELERVREWALAKLATGEEPPWAWYQYMKLRETLDAILLGMDAVTQQTESSPPAGPHRGRRLRLVGATDWPGSAPPAQSDEPVRLPI
jgi:hypothetical protein